MTDETVVPLYASSGEAVEHGTRDARLSQGQKRVHTRNDTDSGDAEKRRETNQSAARPGRAPQDHHGARAMLNTTARDQKGETHSEAK